METHPKKKNEEKIKIKIDLELIELIPTFLVNRGTDVQAMNKALKTGDYIMIERTGHGMKGAGAGFGFDAITEIGAKIESAAKIKDWEIIQKAIGDLGNYLQHLEVVYG